MTTIKISQTSIPSAIGGDKNPNQKKAASNSTPTPKIENDSVQIDPPKKDLKLDSTPVILFDTPPVDLQLNRSDKKPFGIKSFYLKAGYIAKNNVLFTGPMHIRNDAYGTDLTISGAQQIERGSWSYVDPTKVFTGQQKFRPDEPQFNIGLGVRFNNNFGLELDAKHYKVIMDGYDQNVHFEGMMNGQYVNMDAPLNTFMAQHEQTLGNMNITLAPTYTVDLVDRGLHNLSFTTKLGPSLITTNTRSNFKTPDGEWEQQTSGLEVVGFGALMENEIEYKVGRVGLAVGHSLSALNYKSYTYGAGGTGSHKALNSAFTVKATVDIFRNK